MLYMLARANSACLLALSRSDRHLLALLLVRVDCAVLFCAVLCCAVLAEQRKQINSKDSPTNNIIVGNYGLRRAERWEYMPSMSSEIGEICLSLARLLRPGERAGDHPSSSKEQRLLNNRGGTGMLGHKPTLEDHKYAYA